MPDRNDSYDLLHEVSGGLPEIRRMTLSSMVHKAFVTLALSCVVLAACGAHAAGPDADAVLPSETVGFASIANLPDFRARWNRTQIGQLFDLPEMEPFLRQLRDQATERDGKIEDRLGVTFEELGDASSGEVAFALLPPVEADDLARVVVLADVSDRRLEAEQVVAKIETRLKERGASSLESPAEQIRVFSVPYGEGAPRTVAYFLHSDRFVACNDAELAGALLPRVTGRPTDSLKENDSYQATLRKADGATPKIHRTFTWWASPFAYSDAAQTLDGPAKVDDEEDAEDLVAILREEGFDAVEGVGGRVALSVDNERDVVHVTAVFASPKAGAEGRPASERFDGALGALETPNTEDLTIEPWVPSSVASYKTLNLDVQNLFDNIASLVDAFVYKNAFQNTLEAFDKDPYGPKINLRDEVVANLGGRLTTMTDYSTPITFDCERYLIVVEVANEEGLREPLDKWMESDGAEKKTLTTPAGEELYYWEIVPAEGEADLDSLDDGLLPVDDEDALFIDFEEPREERVLRRAAVCLHDEELVIGSDVEFLRQVLFGAEQADSLAADPEVARVRKALDRLTPPDRAAWSFTRTEQSFLPTYEFVRTNRMPEAQTFLARLLNRVLTTADEREAHLVRDQKIDGSSLPEFDLVKPYLGPMGRTVRSADDGWVIVGVVLRSDTK